jgi:hypothetical protein
MSAAALHPVRADLMSEVQASSPLRTAEVVAALSLATDLGTGQPMGHALRVCLLSLALAGEMGLDVHERRDVYDSH